MYFQSKFLSRELFINYPVFEQQSKLLNQYYLNLFFLSHSFFQEADKLKLVYRANSENISFASLTKKLLEFDGSTLIVIKHNELIYNFQDQDHSYQPFIFGGFRAGKWRNEQKFQGNKNCFLFSIEPKFQIFSPNKIRQNELGMHCYLNTLPTSSFPVGFGFGGNAENQRFRIWVDEDLQTKSYCTSKDETYDDGIIAMNNISEFKINEIEVWGVPTANFDKISYINPVSNKAKQQQQQQPLDINFLPRESKSQQLENKLNLNKNNLTSNYNLFENKDFQQKYNAKQLLLNKPNFKENFDSNLDFENKKKLLNFTEIQSFVLQERKTDNQNQRSYQASPVNVEELIRQSELRFNKLKLEQIQELNKQNFLGENERQESKNLTFGEISEANKYPRTSNFI